MFFAQIQPPFNPDGLGPGRLPHLPGGGGDGEALRRLGAAADDVHRFLVHVASTNWWNGFAAGVLAGLALAVILYHFHHKKEKP